MWLLLIASKFPMMLKKSRGALRVAGYVGAVSLGLGVFSFGRARAHMNEALIDVGTDMLSLKEFIGQKAEFELNGEKLYAGTGTSDRSVKVILDSFEQNCKSTRQDAANVHEWLEKPTNLIPGNARVGDLLKFRRESSDQGILVCTAPTPQIRSLRDEALAFARTKDMNELGGLRYVMVNKAASGRSSLVMLWTAGAFRFGNLIQEDGNELGGADSGDFPRPEGAKRHLRVRGLGTPFTNSIFTTSMKAEEVLPFYDREMEKRGYDPVADPGLMWRDERQVGQFDTHAYVKGQGQVIVSVARTETDTTVNISELATNEGSGSHNGLAR